MPIDNFSNAAAAEAARRAAAEAARKAAEEAARKAAAAAAKKAAEEAAKKAAAEAGKKGPAKTGELDKGFFDKLKLGGASGTSKLGLGTGRLGELEKKAPEAVKPNTIEEARKEADALLYGGVAQPDSDYRKIEADAKDVNAMPSAEDLEKTKQLIAENGELEQQALEGLEPDQREQYDAIAKELDSDPEARLSLQMLALDKKLTDGPKDADGKSLLDNLDTLRTSSKAEGLEGAKMLSQVVQEIQTPDAINQHNRGTCTMASTQILMATKQPAEYARLVTGLASPEGKVKLANGDEITRFKDTNKPDDTPRTDSARMFQATMMDYANGGDDYENTAEAGGLDAGEVDKALEGLFAQKVNSQDIKTGAAGFLGQMAPGVTNDKDWAMDMVADKANSGSPVPVGLNWGERDESGKTHGGHKVLVTKVEGDRVYYDNPWGSQESMPKAEFEKRLKNVHEFDPTKLGEPGDDEGIVEKTVEKTVEVAKKGIDIVTAPVKALGGLLG